MRSSSGHSFFGFDLTEFALRYLPNLLEAFRSPITDLLHNRWTRILSLEDVMKKVVVLMPDLTIFISRYQGTRTDAIRGFEGTPLLPRPRPRSYLPPQSRRLPRPLRLFSTSSSSDGSVTPQTSSPTTSVSLQSEGTAYADMSLSVTATLMSLTTWLRRLPSSKESSEEAVDKRSWWSWWRCEVGKKQKRVGCSGKGDEQLLSCG
ncbi:hypothetical protein BDY24DRAFT_442940 [Mrakia frigida]|uniref:uncharacterized protein n=1 Tax=Mrakia frigida TaxID=29902 RepID=UPI003FCBFA9E